MLALGVLCLLPTGLATHAYYAHIWDDIVHSLPDTVPLLLSMTPVYLSLVAGPILIVGGAIAILARGAVSSRTVLTILVGGIVTGSWAAFGLALQPPDLPVRILLGVMGGASVVVVIGAVGARRRIP